MKPFAELCAEAPVLGLEQHMARLIEFGWTLVVSHHDPELRVVIRAAKEHERKHGLRFATREIHFGEGDQSLPNTAEGLRKVAELLLRASRVLAALEASDLGKGPEASGDINAAASGT